VRIYAVSKLFKVWGVERRGVRVPTSGFARSWVMLERMLCCFWHNLVKPKLLGIVRRTVLCSIFKDSERSIILCMEIVIKLLRDDIGRAPFRQHHAVLSYPTNAEILRILDARAGYLDYRNSRGAARHLVETNVIQCEISIRTIWNL
jgi:hypothetical protein